MAKKRMISPSRQRKPVDPENPVEVLKASQEGYNKGVKKKYESPAARQRVVEKLNPGKPGVAPKAEMAVVTYRQTLAAHIRAIGEELVEFTGPEGERLKWKRIDAVVRRLYSEALAGKTAAAELLFERGWGKLPTPVAIDLRGEVTQILETTGLSLKEAAADPILGTVLKSAGIVIEGKVSSDRDD